MIPGSALISFSSWCSVWTCFLFIHIVTESQHSGQHIPLEQVGYFSQVTEYDFSKWNCTLHNKTYFEKIVLPSRNIFFKLYL